MIDINMEKLNRYKAHQIEFIKNSKLIESLKRELITDLNEYFEKKMKSHNKWEYNNNGAEWDYSTNKITHIENLIKNFVTIDKNEEIRWIKWKIIHINLPQKWKFKWYKFNFFVSEKSIDKIEFENNKKIKKKSFSIKEISNLLRALNEFLKENKIECDITNKYEQLIWIWWIWRCLTWDVFKWITWLNSIYRLKDKNISVEGTQAIFNCWSDYYSNFTYTGICSSANLLLKI